MAMPVKGTAFYSSMKRELSQISLSSLSASSETEQISGDRDSANYLVAKREKRAYALLSSSYITITDSSNFVAVPSIDSLPCDDWLSSSIDNRSYNIDCNTQGMTSCNEANNDHLDDIFSGSLKRDIEDCTFEMNEETSLYRVSIADVSIMERVGSQEDLTTIFMDDSIGTLGEEDGRNDTFIMQASTASTPLKACDFLSTLPDELLYRVTAFLDAKSLVLSLGCTNSVYHQKCRNDAAGWEHLCRTTWQTKCHVASEATRLASKKRFPLDASATHYNAYRVACKDAQERQHITESELCYDLLRKTGSVWSFRFKASAGTDWTSADPWYSGLPARKLIFLRDGSIKEAVPEIPTSVSEAQDEKNLEYARDYQNEINPRTQNDIVYFNQDNIMHTRSRRSSAAKQSIFHDNNIQSVTWKFLNPPISMSWRFVLCPMDLPKRIHPGSYVRINMGGRDVPTYFVSRSTSGNWGFVMESCWGVLASFELPPQKNSLPMKCNQGDRDNQSSMSSSVSVEFSSMHGCVPRCRENQKNSARRVQHTKGCNRSIAKADYGDNDSHLQDETLFVTNEIQWREAFLYNVGARLLPDGDEAIQVFDQAWGGMYH